MFSRSGYFWCTAAVTIALSIHATIFVKCEEDLPGNALAISRRAVSDYWSYASIAANSLPSIPGISGSMTQASEIVDALYNNPDFGALFKEMPELLNELKNLDKEQISNILFLFQFYKSLPPSLIKFFHNVISRIKSVAPIVHDMAKFNIASELSAYSQSITDPVKNTFAKIASYIPKIYRRAPGQGPSWADVGKTVAEILISNIGVPPPLIPFNILQQSLTKLTKAYIDGNLKMPPMPQLPSLPGLPNFKLPSLPKFNKKIQWKTMREIMNGPKKPRFPGRKPKPPTPAAA